MLEIDTLRSHSTRLQFFRRAALQFSHHLIGVALNGQGIISRKSSTGERWLHSKLVGQIDSLLDIGSNVGAYWRLVRRTNPRCEVIAVEPVQQFLSHSLGHPGVAAVQEFLSDESGHSVELYRRARGATALKSFDSQKIAEKFMLETVTLDQLMARFPAFKPDFIKIDVDGFDFAVLRGGTRTIARSRPIIQIELGKFFFLNGENAMAFLNFVQEASYEPFILLPRSLLKVSSVDQIFALKHSVNAVLLPQT